MIKTNRLRFIKNSLQIITFSTLISFSESLHASNQQELNADITELKMQNSLEFGNDSPQTLSENKIITKDSAELEKIIKQNETYSNYGSLAKRLDIDYSKITEPEQIREKIIEVLRISTYDSELANKKEHMIAQNESQNYGIDYLTLEKFVVNEKERREFYCDLLLFIEKQQCTDLKLKSSFAIRHYIIRDVLNVRSEDRYLFLEKRRELRKKGFSYGELDSFIAVGLLTGITDDDLQRRLNFSNEGSYYELLRSNNSINIENERLFMEELDQIYNKTYKFDAEKYFDFCRKILKEKNMSSIIYKGKNF